MKTPLKEDSSYEVDGLRCEVHFNAHFHPTEMEGQKPLEEFFGRQLREANPAWVWAHYTDFFAVTSAMQWNPERASVILTDNEYPRQSQLDAFPSVGPHYRNIKHVVVASRFMEESVRRDIPWAKVLRIPNPLTKSLQRTPVEGRSPKAFVFVNPTEVKGVEFALQIATQLPHENFLFVGNWVNEGEERSFPKNVSFIPRQNNMDVIWAQAKALLMPSVWEEAFGRLALEAMAAGVPVVSSDRGALPETVGKGGLSLPLDLTQWVSVLGKTTSPLYDAQQLQRGFERVRAYERETLDRFEELRREWKV